MLQMIMEKPKNLENVVKDTPLGSVMTTFSVTPDLGPKMPPVKLKDISLTRDGVDCSGKTCLTSACNPMCGSY